MLAKEIRGVLEERLALSRDTLYTERQPWKHDAMLPDILQPGLTLVLAGVASGKKSAERGAYYADAGNRFWRTLAAVGFTDRLYQPEEFRSLLKLGIGMTDLCKTQAGMDKDIGEFDVPAFNAKMNDCKPAAVAFTSKNAARVWLGERSTESISYGWLEHSNVLAPPVFVLSSTSGASGHWSEAPWKELQSWWWSQRNQ